MMSRIDTRGGAHIPGKVKTGGGSFVGRDQINLTLIGDLSADRIESALPLLRDLLARPDTRLAPEPGAGSGPAVLRLTSPTGDSLLLSEQAAKALSYAAARRGEIDGYISPRWWSIPPTDAGSSVMFHWLVS